MGRSADVRVRRLRSEDDGDGVVLCRLAPGAEYEHPSARPSCVLVLEGALDIGRDAGARVATAGTYTPLDSPVLRAADDAALLLVLSGRALGRETRNLRGSSEWRPAGEGMVALPLGEKTTEAELAERTVAAVRVEPAARVPRHHHPTAHLFLYLDGDVDDKIVFPDGRHDHVVRHPGDFVVYPFPVEHELSSRTGCTIFFVHEPVLYSAS